jgi:hypothetical protein
VEAWYGRVWLAATAVEYSVSGEAAVVEVAPGRYLIALVDEDMIERFRRVVQDKVTFEKEGKWLGSIAEIDDIATLDPDNYPLLVTFKENDDPKSVRRVNPDDLAAVFGAGHSLRAITMEITDER